LRDARAIGCVAVCSGKSIGVVAVLMTPLVVACIRYLMLWGDELDFRIKISTGFDSDPRPQCRNFLGENHKRNELK